jgi:hypothetical protein
MSAAVHAMASKVARAIAALTLGALGGASSLAGCTATVQDLGGETAPDPVSTESPIDKTCPSVAPLTSRACATEYSTPCVYYVDPSKTATVSCACAIDGHWSCFEASGGILAPSSCSQGAECEQGSQCATVEGFCACDSAGQLRCTGPNPVLH